MSADTATKLCEMLDGHAAPPLWACARPPDPLTLGTPVPRDGTGELAIKAVRSMRAMLQWMGRLFPECPKVPAKLEELAGMAGDLPVGEPPSMVTQLVLNKLMDKWWGVSRDHFTVIFARHQSGLDALFEQDILAAVDAREKWNAPHITEEHRAEAWARLHHITLMVAAAQIFESARLASMESAALCMAADTPLCGESVQALFVACLSACPDAHTCEHVHNLFRWITAAAGGPAQLISAMEGIEKYMLRTDDALEGCTGLRSRAMSV